VQIIEMDETDDKNVSFTLKLHFKEHFRRS